MDFRIAAGAVALSLFAPHTALAGEWSVSASLFHFGAKTETAIDTGGGIVRSKLSYSTAVRRLDGPFVAGIEARNGRLGLMADLNSTSVSPRVRGFPYWAFTGGTDEVTAHTINAYATWRLVETRRVDLDIAAGARWLGAETALVLVPITVGPPLRTVIDETAFNAVLGVRGTLRFGERWTATAMVDAGGNGGDSTAQAVATVGYALNDRVSLVGGFRLTDYELETEAGTEFGFRQTGSLLGVNFRF